MPSTPISASWRMFSQGKEPSSSACPRGLNSPWTSSRTAAMRWRWALLSETPVGAVSLSRSHSSTHIGFHHLPDETFDACEDLRPHLAQGRRFGLNGAAAALDQRACVAHDDALWRRGAGEQHEHRLVEAEPGDLLGQLLLLGP